MSDIREIQYVSPSVVAEPVFYHNHSVGSCDECWEGS